MESGDGTERVGDDRKKESRKRCKGTERNPGPRRRTKNRTKIKVTVKEERGPRKKVRREEEKCLAKKGIYNCFSQPTDRRGQNTFDVHFARHIPKKPRRRKWSG